MTDKQFITRLLDINQPMFENPVRFSTMTLLLRGARQLFGCNLDSGQYEMNEFNEENFTNKTYHSFQITGLINYLIFLDQIGITFKPKNIIPTHNKTNGVFCALKYFTTLEEEKIQAIRALRNSLAHQFGLATEKNPKLPPPRKFILSVERNSEIVRLPKTNWDGNFSIKSDDAATTIFIIDLIIMIESLYQKLISENNVDNLELILPEGIEELKTRFTLVY